MRRLVLGLVAMLVLINTAIAAGDAAQPDGAEKKGKKTHHKTRHRAHRHHGGHVAAGENNGGPFADVPRGHWAYDAVQKAAEAGILQGWNNRFHGNKVVNRYQMAVVVARMLDRVGVLRSNGKVITAQDIANLESLVIEFADELALLNVKVSTLEDTVAGLRKDVDLIKADLRGVGARAGITGLMDTRFVSTGDGSPGYRLGLVNGAGGTSTFAPPPSATSPVVRYRGQAVTASVPGLGGGLLGGLLGSANPSTFDNRDFFTVANFAINIDREFDPHTHFHAQVNINAEGSVDDTGLVIPPTGLPIIPPGNLGGLGGLGAAGRPLAGRGGSFFAGNLMVNELYVVFDDWFTDGVNGRLGVFALPMNTEVNGPSRTYLWTVTPSIANSKWESIRPVGLDLFQHNDKDSWVFYVGFFTPGDTSNGIFRSGTLLSQNNLILNGQIDFGGLSTIGSIGDLLNLGFYPTPLSDAAMTDAARGIDGQSLANDDVGFYGQVGQHPTCKDHRGLSWHVAYFDRNGNIRRGSDGSPSLTDWRAAQAAVSYQWSDVMFMAQYYDANSKNYSVSDILTLDPLGLVDGRRVLSTPMLTFSGADTISQSFMTMVNWQFSRRGSATVRYEKAADFTEAAKIEAEVWTFAFNWRTSDHGWLQMEYIDPETRTRATNGGRNPIDIDDSLFTANYKLAW
jgi:hypothetical protein